MENKISKIILLRSLKADYIQVTKYNLIQLFELSKVLD